MLKILQARLHVLTWNQKPAVVRAIIDFGDLVEAEENLAHP